MNNEDRAYEVTRQWIDEFEKDLREFESADNSDMHPRLRQACRAGMVSMLASLREEAAEYECKHGAFVPESAQES